jgi:transcriptional regulator with XRE-family HTH domain
MHFLGDNLSYLRKKKGLLQSQMQQEIGFTRSTWSNYENGLAEPSVENLLRIAHFFDVSLDSLLGSDLSTTVATEKTAGRDRQPLPYELVPESYSAVKEPRQELTNILEELKRLREEIQRIRQAVKKKKKK